MTTQIYKPDSQSKKDFGDNWNLTILCYKNDRLYNLSSLYRDRFIEKLWRFSLAVNLFEAVFFLIPLLSLWGYNIRVIKFRLRFFDLILEFPAGQTC